MRHRISAGVIVDVEDRILLVRHPEMRICKLWFIGRVIGGELTATASGAAAEHIVDAQFIGREDFRGKVVFPRVLSEQYWVDKSSGFATARYLGVREMKLY